jgi:hypothetical protein
MSVNNASWILINNSSVMLQIVASLADNSRGVIYDCNILTLGFSMSKVTDKKVQSNTDLFSHTQEYLYTVREVWLKLDSINEIKKLGSF